MLLQREYCGVTLECVQVDIADLPDTDAIVNTANTRLLPRGVHMASFTVPMDPGWMRSAVASRPFARARWESPSGATCHITTWPTASGPCTASEGRPASCLRRATGTLSALRTNTTSVRLLFRPSQSAPSTIHLKQQHGLLCPEFWTRLHHGRW